jgi:uncharacterized protein involved in high-affinity Fe2+ transport
MNKTHAKIIADPRVSDVSDETGYGEGVWVYLKPEYVSTSTDTGTIHEDTWTEALKVLKQNTRARTDEDVP